MLNKLAKRKNSIAFVALVGIMALSMMPQSSAVTIYYDIRIKLTSVYLCVDGDNSSPGELQWVKPNGVTDLGSYSDSDPVYACPQKSFSVTYSTTSSSAANEYHFQLRDDDVWRTQSLWEGSVFTTQDTGGWVTIVSDTSSTGSVYYSSSGITFDNDYAKSKTVTTCLTGLPCFSETVYNQIVLQVNVATVYFGGF